MCKAPQNLVTGSLGAIARLNTNGALLSSLAWFERPKEHIAGKQAQNDGERSDENVGDIR